MFIGNSMKKEWKATLGLAAHILFMAGFISVFLSMFGILGFYNMYSCFPGFPKEVVYIPLYMVKCFTLMDFIVIIGTSFFVIPELFLLFVKLTNPSFR